MAARRCAGEIFAGIGHPRRVPAVGIALRRMFSWQLRRESGAITGWGCAVLGGGEEQEVRPGGVKEQAASQGRLLSQGVVDGYLRDASVAARLCISAKTLRNKVAAGIFREGVHFFRPAGMTRRWSWPAVATWVEAGSDDFLGRSTIRLARSSHQP